MERDEVENFCMLWQKSRLMQQKWQNVSSMVLHFQPNVHVMYCTPSIWKAFSHFCTFPERPCFSKVSPYFLLRIWHVFLFTLSRTVLKSCLVLLYHLQFTRKSEYLEISKCSKHYYSGWYICATKIFESFLPKCCYFAGGQNDDWKKIYPLCPNISFRASPILYIEDSNSQMVMNLIGWKIIEVVWFAKVVIFRILPASQYILHTWAILVYISSIKFDLLHEPEYMHHNESILSTGTGMMPFSRMWNLEG